MIFNVTFLALKMGNVLRFALFAHDGCTGVKKTNAEAGPTCKASFTSAPPALRHVGSFQNL
jgi:hypothetical protein